jgi:hypothetical protein
MASHPPHPRTNPDINDETRRILEARLLTIDIDAKDSVSRDNSREEIRKLRQSLKPAVLR